jgi:DNA-binding transcriptional LysR family regulator
MLQIDYFLAVADKLSFTEAANTLYTSQSSVSKQIALLEKQIGVDLFYRTKRSVRLSAAGEVLYEGLNGISEKIDSAIEDAVVASTGERNTLNIGVFSGIDTGFFLPGFLHKFRSEHSNINLGFERRHFQQLREKLINGHFDLIVTFDFDIPEKVKEAAALKVKPIKPINTCILVSSNDPLSSKEEITLEDFKNAKFVIISREESPGGNASVLNFFERYGLSPCMMEELPNYDSLLLAVQAGEGVTVIDYDERRNMQPGIKAIRLEDDFNEVIIAWRKDDAKPALRIFIDELSIYISEQDVG